MEDDALNAQQERLLARLRALASPVRLHLLRSLVVPTTSADLRVPAPGGRAGFAAGRSLGRSTVIEHLEILEEAGFVRRVGDEFAVDQQGLVAFLQELGALARLRAAVVVDVETTVAVTDRKPTWPVARPRLVVVDGPEAGVAISLASSGPWRIGREAGCEVPLRHDPHVSRAHAIIRREGQEFLVEVDVSAKNPVHVDSLPVSTGTAARLASGAVLGIGSTQLVLQP